MHAVSDAETNLLRKTSQGEEEEGEEVNIFRLNWGQRKMPILSNQLQHSDNSRICPNQKIRFISINKGLGFLRSTLTLQFLTDYVNPRCHVIENCVHHDGDTHFFAPAKGGANTARYPGCTADLRIPNGETTSRM